MSSQARVAILSFSPIERDARLQRQIHALATNNELCVVGYGSLGAAAALSNVRMTAVPLPAPSRLRSAAVLGSTLLGRMLPQLGYWAWNQANEDHRAAARALVACRPALIVANDWKALPVALRAARSCGAGVVADLHEYAPALWDHDPMRSRLFRPLIEHELHAAAPRLLGAVTVNQTIADKYAQEFGLRCGVVRNVPAARNPAAFRATQPGAIRLVHHGVANRERKLHLMIEALALCKPELSLHFMLVDQDGYIAEMRALAARVAPGRVHFDPVVAPDKIVGAIAQYDVGFYLLPPGTFNQHAALPNKFFEFLFAGLAVCVGPSPEMARLTEQFQCGTVVPSFEPADAAKVLNGLSAPELDRMKQHSIAACEQVRPEHEAEVMRKLVRDALSGAQSAAR